MPAAKLLAGNERRAVPAIDLRVASGLPALAFLTAFVFFLLRKNLRLIPAFGSSRLLPANRRPAPVWANSAAKFIRPPPRFR
jgi:hypothetical protein